MKKSKTAQVILPNREVINSAQVGLLLQTVQSLTGCLRDPQVEIGTEPAKELDGGVRTAIEATVINACNRLDNIVTESERWGMKAQNAIEKLYEAQTKLVNESLKPSARYRPKLYSLTHGWAAVLGDIRDLDNSVCGVGSSPQEALDAFDGVFVGQIAPHLVEWLKQVELAHARGEPPPPFKQQNENQQSVDRQGNSEPKKDEGSGSNSRGDSQSPGSDEDSSRPPGGPFGSDSAI